MNIKVSKYYARGDSNSESNRKFLAPSLEKALIIEVGNKVVLEGFRDVEHLNLFNEIVSETLKEGEYFNKELAKVKRDTLYTRTMNELNLTYTVIRQK